MGEGWRCAAFGRSGAFGARGTSAHHATLSSCPLQVTRVCSLAAVLHGGAAAFGRSGHWQRGLRPAGAFVARWHLHCLDFGPVINLT